jgi:hypothetical protein
MDRLLCTCPTRGRPEIIKNMLDSFQKTKHTNTDLVIFVDDDDPALSKYMDVLNNTYYHLGSRMPVAQIHNRLVKSHPDYDYYMPINDDVTFLEKGWDTSLMNAIEERGNGFGIAYGRDTDGESFYPPFPTFSIVSSNIVNSLGYIYPRELNKLFGDTFLLDIGRAIGKLYYVPEVVIKHKQPIHLDTYEHTTKEFYNSERDAYARYIDNNLDADVMKLFEAIISRSNTCLTSAR